MAHTLSTHAGVSDPSVTAPGGAPPERTPDALHLEAALWRAYRLLSGHWLHALRGSLNGMSLNLVLLKGTVNGGPDESTKTLRTQLRELDASLTRYLDQSLIEDAAPGRTDVASLVNGTCSLVEPLARRRQVAVDLSNTAGHCMARIDGWVVQGVLVPLLVELVTHGPARSAIRIELTEDEDAGMFRIHVRPETDVDAPVLDLPFREAARRVIETYGGQLHDLADRRGGVTLLLQRSQTAAN